jgi:hypothetical protein
MKLQGQLRPVALCQHVRTEKSHFVRGPVIKLRRHLDGQGNQVRSQIAYVSAIVAEMIILLKIASVTAWSQQKPDACWESYKRNRSQQILGSEICCFRVSDWPYSPK